MLDGAMAIRHEDDNAVHWVLFFYLLLALAVAYKAQRFLCSGKASVHMLYPACCQSGQVHRGKGHEGEWETRQTQDKDR